MNPLTLLVRNLPHQCLMNSKIFLLHSLFRTKADHFEKDLEAIQWACLMQ
jgi:hypothetical protein